VRKSLVVVLGALVGLTSGAVAARGASPGTNPFTNAGVHFNIDNGTVETIQARDTLPSDYIPSTIFYQFCSPPGDSETDTIASGTFDVAADGKLTGSCEASRTSTVGGGASIVVAKQGTLSGTYDLGAQTVKFHFEGSSTYTYIQPPTCKGNNCGPATAVMNVVVDGPLTGGEVIGDLAEGTARHTYTCGPTPQCPVVKQVGTGKFRIQFFPALATAAPGPDGAGATGGEDPPDFPTALIFLILLALVLLGIAALRRHTSFRALAEVAGAADSLAAAVGPDSEPAAPAGTAAATVKDVVDTGADLLGGAEASARDDWNRKADAAAAAQEIMDAADPDAATVAEDQADEDAMRKRVEEARRNIFGSDGSGGPA
jgi:hypothetical protein